MARLSLFLLGTFRVVLAGEPVTAFAYDKVRALLAYLAVESDRAHRRETLAGLLWPERPEGNARQSLSQALFRLRRIIGDHQAIPPFLTITPQTIQFNPASDCQLDVTTFTALLAACKTHDHHRLEACEPCLERLQQAVALYRGRFLEGFSLGGSPAFEEWVVLNQEQFQRLVTETLRHLADCYEQRGEYEEALPYAWRQVELEPWQEAGHRRLMRLLALDGQRSAALAQYESCGQILAEELGVAPEAETTALYERIRAGELSPAVEKQPDWGERAIRHNLPPSPTPFVGREKELTQLARRLEDPACRLLTLTGPGGIGKTRLALQAASDLIEAPSGQLIFSDGIYFVNVTPISSTDSLVATVAEALGFSFYRDVSPRQQLLDYLRAKEMLLGLDNFEHLLSPPQVGMKEGAFPDKEMQERASSAGEKDGATELVTDILATAPAVKILVTSREALNLQKEWLFPVDGLPFPSGDATEKRDPTMTLAAYSAVQLFEQCARRARPGFSLAAETEDVVRICQMVEGMPLGIELAAAWLKMFPCEKIRRELERGFDLLTTSLKDVPARHRSMRAVFEHSWRFLPEEERGEIKRLSVFRGGFRQGAAEQVVGATWSDLVALGEKSLLRLTPAGRYQVHELLRQFAAEKLQAVPEEEEAAQRRHSAYYLAYLQQREEALKGKHQQTALAEISPEIENTRLGWLWAVGQNDIERLEQALDSLYEFYDTSCRFQEGRMVFAETAAHFQATINKLDCEALWGRVLARQGAFCVRLAHYKAARCLLRQSLSLARRLDARAEIAFCLNYLGLEVAAKGGRRGGIRLLQESVAINRELGDPAETAFSLVNLGYMVMREGDFWEANQLCQEGLTMARETGRQDRIAYLLDVLGWLTYLLERYGESEQYYQESLAIFQEIDSRLGIAMALGGLAWVTLHREGLRKGAAAKASLEESLAICQELGCRQQMLSQLQSLGDVTIRLSEYQEAHRYYQEMVEICHRYDVYSYYLVGGLRGSGDAACGLGDFQAARQYLREALDIVMRDQLPPIYLVEVLTIWVAVLVKESDVVKAGDSMSEMISSGTKKKVQAVELLGWCLDHLADWMPWFKDRATHFLAELEAELPPDVFATALERGKARKLEEVVAEVLAEG